MLFNEVLKNLHNYFKGATLEWESGVSTTTKATQDFCNRVQKFTVRIVGTIEYPKMLITSAYDPNDVLFTSCIEEVFVSDNGYARVKTGNTTYHFWNTQKHEDMRVDEALKKNGPHYFLAIDQDLIGVASTVYIENVKLVPPRTCITYTRLKEKALDFTCEEAALAFAQRHNIQMYDRELRPDDDTFHSHFVAIV